MNKYFMLLSLACIGIASLLSGCSDQPVEAQKPVEKVIEDVSIKEYTEAKNSADSEYHERRQELITLYLIRFKDIDPNSTEGTALRKERQELIEKANKVRKTKIAEAWNILKQKKLEQLNICDKEERSASQK